MISFDLTILGTSSALPTLKRYPTAQVLNVRERFFLIDCGEGTQIQMKKYGVKSSRINHIFISHLHGDHYFGLIGFLSSLALLGRKNDLHIYAHSLLPDLLKPQLEVLNEDFSFKIIWHPLNFKTQQIIFEDDAVKVTSFPLKHRIPCCGFLFTEAPLELKIRKEKIDEHQIPVRELFRIKAGYDYIKDDGSIINNAELTFPASKQRKYAFCTDTVYLPELATLLKDVDLLYHEATYDKSLEKRATETFHSTAEQAAEQAKNSNAGQLLLGHFSARYKDQKILLDEAKAVFPNSYLAEEGDVIKIPQTPIVID
jgi:ribonuclease Z